MVPRGARGSNAREAPQVISALRPPRLCVLRFKVLLPCLLSIERDGLGRAMTGRDITHPQKLNLGRIGSGTRMTTNSRRVLIPAYFCCRGVVVCWGQLRWETFETGPDIVGLAALEGVGDHLLSNK
jgi:hypothetical protein